METILIEERYIPLGYDLMFKKVFGDEKDKRPLKYLLKVVLGIDAKKIRILNNEILGESYRSKRTTVDLIVELEDGTKIGIEMNRTVSKEVIDRNLVYMFRMMGSDLKHGEKYGTLDKHIQVNFDMEGIHKTPIEKYKLINTKDVNNVLTEKIEIIRIDVSYYTKKCYNLNEKQLKEIDKLVGLIGIEDIKCVKKILGKEDDIMGEIVKKMRGFTKEDAILMSYDRDFHVAECARIAAERDAKELVNKLLAEKLEEKTKEISQKLIKQGSDETIIKIAKNLLLEKIPIDLISKVTGLTKKQILDIK